jgi:hypothetical protein
LLNVYDPTAGEKVELEKFPDGHRQRYTWEPSADADGPERLATLLYKPTAEEALAMLQGATVRLSIVGVRTPPQVRLDVIDLGRNMSEPDFDAAKVLYEAAGGHPVPWEQATDGIKQLYAERALALWRAFEAHRGAA